MSDTLSIGLTDKQRETLLSGLQYVRSSILLDMRDPDPAMDADRERRLQEVEELQACLKQG